MVDFHPAQPARATARPREKGFETVKKETEIQCYQKTIWLLLWLRYVNVVIMSGTSVVNGTPVSCYVVSVSGLRVL